MTGSSGFGLPRAATPAPARSLDSDSAFHTLVFLLQLLFLGVSIQPPPHTSSVSFTVSHLFP